MKISIFGMGYVGATSAACLLDDGHEIVGVDVNPLKVEKLSQGKSPMIQEPGIEELLYKGYKEGRLTATTDSEEGVRLCDMIWICVGTPSNFDGSIDLSYVKKVIEDIGLILKKIKNRPLIVIRSTCLPGTMDNIIKPLLEKTSGLVVDKDIDLIFHPEFMREGSAISDFKNPAKIVTGSSAHKKANLLLNIYKNYKVVRFRFNYKEAEMVKYCDNIFHALKITFANEMAIVSKSIGIDSRNVAEAYMSDYKLNISPAYLYPGFAYGGSCLPKDLNAMLRFASSNSLQLPMVNGIVESNEKQIKNLIYRILSHKPSKVGMIGIAFKKDTDDIRNSPYVEVAKSLIGEGITLKIYDPLVRKECLIGSNKKQFYQSFRNIDNLLVDSLDELSSVDLIIVNHNIIGKEMIYKWMADDINIVDLVGIESEDYSNDKYDGLYW